MRRTGERVRSDFPLLMRQVHGKPLIYFDNANTGQKPLPVIAATDEFYRRQNANVSRAVHALGTEATDAYEGARGKLAHFLNVRTDELVLCSGTTFAINLVAYSWALPRLKAGDVILVSRMEHHANIVPWQLVAERTGATIRVAEIHDRRHPRPGSAARGDDRRSQAVGAGACLQCAGHGEPGARDLPRGAQARHRDRDRWLAGGAAPARGRGRNRLRFLRTHRPQDVRADRHRRAVGATRAPAGDAAVPGAVAR